MDNCRKCRAIPNSIRRNSKNEENQRKRKFQTIPDALPTLRLLANRCSKFGYLKLTLTPNPKNNLKILEPFTHYSFFVRAERGQQIGENGTNLEYTKLSPTQNVEIKDRTDKTARLSWNDVHGAIKYTILYQSLNPVKNEELSESSIGTKFKLTGLLHGSTYKLQIIAEAKETTGLPKGEKFDTFLETPLNIRTIKYHTTSAKICRVAVFMADGYTVHYGSLRPEDRTARLKERVQKS